MSIEAAAEAYASIANLAAQAGDYASDEQIATAIIAAFAGDRVLYRHRSENSCLGCESDMNSCIDAFTNDLGKCCKGCDHSEFVQVYPEVNDGD